MQKCSKQAGVHPKLMARKFGILRFGLGFHVSFPGEVYQKRVESIIGSPVLVGKLKQNALFIPFMIQVLEPLIKQCRYTPLTAIGFWGLPKWTFFPPPTALKRFFFGASGVLGILAKRRWAAPRSSSNWSF